MPHRNQGDSDNRLTNYRQLLLLSLLCIGIVWLIEYPIRPVYAAVNTNTLLIGNRALLDGPYELPVIDPQEFDGLTKPQIYRLRKQSVWQHPLLMDANYHPSDEVFGGIRDGSPWWGLQGQFYFGRGPRSPEGLSEESRFVLNPYLLVAPEFVGLLKSSGKLKWDRARITQEQLDSEGFPLYCAASSVTWWPAQSRMAVSYDLSGYLQQLNSFVTSPLNVEDATFTLVSGNARDMNLNFLYVSPLESLRIEMFRGNDRPMEIDYFLHEGESCGCKGGCIDASPRQTALAGYAIEALPARAEVLLWREEPESLSQTPEMRVTIRFE